jgi:hypothetical protein
MRQIDTGEGPGVIADCCAQFVVDRKLIRRLPREAWESLHRELMRDDGSDRSAKCYTLERMWSPLFGMPAKDTNPMASYACGRD